MKNVHNDLHIIEHDPLARREAIHGNRPHALVFLEAALDFACDRFQVRLGSARADNEEISEGRDTLKIEDDDALRLFVRCEIGAGFG